METKEEIPDGKRVACKAKSSRNKGLDQMLVPIAEASFNYLAGGVIIGGILGYIIKTITDNKGPNQ
jgi:hypothetical protein